MGGPLLNTIEAAYIRDAFTDAISTTIEVPSAVCAIAMTSLLEFQPQIEASPYAGEMYPLISDEPITGCLDVLPKNSQPPEPTAVAIIPLLFTCPCLYFS